MQYFNIICCFLTFSTLSLLYQITIKPQNMKHINTILALLLIGAIYYKADTMPPSLALCCLFLSNLITNKTK